MAKYPELSQTFSDEALGRTMEILDPADVPGIQMLAENPDATFSLARPLAHPEPATLQPMQDDLAAIMRGHLHFSHWQAGVKRLEFFGATYFDGEPAATTKPQAFTWVSSLALAVNMCGALPDSATRPTTGVVERIATNSPNKERVSLLLGIACQTALREYATTEAVNFCTLPSVKLASRMPGRVAYIRKPLQDSFIPAATLKARVEESVPIGTEVALSRVRLFVHLPGESPYMRVE